MLTKKALSATAGAPKLYVEDVYSTYLYSGNGSTQTITNNIDLSTEGGLVWIKDRTTAYDHQLYDTVRGANKTIRSNLTNSEQTYTTALTSFNNNGFSLGSQVTSNNSGDNFVSFSFRKAKKFFDVVTYTGNGTARTISHNLGSVPGCIIVKRTDTTGAWQVYHRANTAAPETDYLVLNTDAATADSDTRWNDTLPTSTEFSLGTDATVNANSGTYVAYLFAHDAGGFGDAGSDSIIKCGSVVGASQVEVDLGWEPQWLLVKNTSASQDWWVVDNMRGLPVQNTSSAYNASALRPNLSDAETTGFSIAPSSTGFKANVLTSSQTYIYIAIRRGPMKTPESGTSVYNAVARTGTGATATITGVGFPPDLGFSKSRSTTFGTSFQDRLRGTERMLRSNLTDAEKTTSGQLTAFGMDGVTLGADSGDGEWNWNGSTFIEYFLRRAPGFFDVVCYTGTGSNLTIAHNLGVTPELVIGKNRTTAGNNWPVLFNFTSTNSSYAFLNLTSAGGNDTYANVGVMTAQPTSTSLYLSSSGSMNTNTNGHVVYLFASVPGVSKVGSYTGNGSSVTVTTDFQPRFVLVKRTDSTGNWIVGDSARGLVAGNDPYLLLNSTAAEDTDEDWVDVTSTSFTVNETAANANVNTGTYIYLAIA